MDGKKSAGHRRSSNLSTGFQLTGNPKNQKHSCFIDVWDEFCLHHFEDVDPYWARTRVLERLNYAQRLYRRVVPTLGPDGTGVGHVFWYHLETNGMDLGNNELTRLVRALQTVPEWLNFFGGLKSNTNWF
jgi:hypothetical protein